LPPIVITKFDVNSIYFFPCVIEIALACVFRSTIFQKIDRQPA